MPDESIVIGRQAAEIAAKGLDDLGRGLIRQKAQDIARQIEIYLDYHNFSSMIEMENDPELSAIAVTTIGKSGYSAVHDTKAINHFHFNPKIEHTDLHALRYTFPQFWEIIERSLTSETDGLYDWPEVDGLVYRKYMYCVPIHPEQFAPLGLIIATTMSIDEFLRPSREIRQRIITLAERVDSFTQREKQRNAQLRSINRYSRKISSFLRAEELLPYVAETLLTTFQLRSIRVILVHEKTKIPTVVAKAGLFPCQEKGIGEDLVDDPIVESVIYLGKPYLSNDEILIGRKTPDKPCTMERMVVPIKIGHKILGALDMVNDDTKAFADFDLYVVWPLVDQVAIALENARLNQELREMAVVEERNRIAREIHDTLAQGFAGISMLTESAKQALKDDEEDQVEILLERVRSIAKDNLSEARRSVQSLRPNITLSEDIVTLLRGELTRLSQLMNIETQFEAHGETRPVTDAAKLALLRICQEAVNNIKKHAFASQVEINFNFYPDSVSMLIHDDGIGFNPQTPNSNSYGLVFMSERARLVGGVVTVDSLEGVGTKIYVNIPC